MEIGIKMSGGQTDTGAKRDIAGAGLNHRSRNAQDAETACAMFAGAAHIRLTTVFRCGIWRPGGRSGSVCGNRRSRGRTRRIPPAGEAIPCRPDKLRDFIWQREAAPVSGAPERHQKPWSKSLFGRGTVSGKNRPHPAAAPPGSLPHIAEKGRPSAWTAAPSRQSRGFRPLAVCAESCIMEKTSTASRLGTGRSHPHEYRRVPDLQSTAGISGPG